MPRTALTPILTAEAGVNAALVAADATNGMVYPANPKSIVHVKNTGTAATLTVRTNDVVAGLTLPDRTIALPATTGEVFAGPFGTEHVFSDGIHLDFTAGLTATVEVLQVNA